MKHLVINSLFINFKFADAQLFFQDVCSECTEDYSCSTEQCAGNLEFFFHRIHTG